VYKFKGTLQVAAVVSVLQMIFSILCTVQAGSQAWSACVTALQGPTPNSAFISLNLKCV